MSSREKLRRPKLQWRAVLKAHPANPESMAHIGLLEARQGHYKEAVLFYRRASGYQSERSGLRLNLALALFKSGQMKEAIRNSKICARTRRPTPRTRKEPQS